MESSIDNMIIVLARKYTHDTFPYITRIVSGSVLRIGRTTCRCEKCPLIGGVTREYDSNVRMKVYTTRFRRCKSKNYVENNIKKLKKSLMDYVCRVHSRNTSNGSNNEDYRVSKTAGKNINQSDFQHPTPRLSIVNRFFIGSNCVYCPSLHE